MRILAMLYLLASFFLLGSGNDSRFKLIHRRWKCTESSEFTFFNVFVFAGTAIDNFPANHWFSWFSKVFDEKKDSRKKERNIRMYAICGQTAATTLPEETGKSTGIRGQFRRETLHPSGDQLPWGSRDLRGSAWTVLSTRIEPNFRLVTQHGCYGSIEHRPGRPRLRLLA